MARRLEARRLGVLVVSECWVLRMWRREGGNERERSREREGQGQDGPHAFNNIEHVN